MAESDDTDIVAHVGTVEIDVPKSIGYFGGAALAVWLGLIEPPLGLFIAAIPLVKLLNRPNATRAEQTVFGLVDGASKPVGGDGESVVRFTKEARARGQWFGSGKLLGRVGNELGGIWNDAQRLR